MHNATTMNGGTLVNGPLKEYCRQKVIVLFIIFAMFSENCVTPNHDQVNELHIVIFCLNSVLLFSLHLHLSRPINF
jgi:hypothetical protein